MREFFGRYSYSVVKMILNQLAIGLFGAVISLATSDNRIVAIATGIFSVVFYLFLLYVVTWEIGAKDRISSDTGKLKNRPARGVLLALLANIPNYIIAVIFTIGYVGGNTENVWAGNLCGGAKVAAFFTEGMYYGLTAQFSFAGSPLHAYWLTYFLMSVPSILIIGLAYFLGTKNVHFTHLLETLYPESDREPKKKDKDEKTDNNER